MGNHYGEALLSFLLMQAYVPNAQATNTITNVAMNVYENSSTFGVGVGDDKGKVTELEVGSQIAWMAVPAAAGVKVSELEV